MSFETDNWTKPDDVTRSLPNAIGVEKSVLSVIFQYPEKFDDCPNLTEDYFYLPSHRIIFERIRKTLTGALPLELVSFIQGLLSAGMLDRAGGPAAITDIYGYAASPAYFERHVEILGAFYARRLAIQASNAIIATAYESEDASDLIDATSSPISEIHDVLTGNKPAQSTAAILKMCLERFERRCKSEETPMGISTSITEINHLFNGLHGKHTIVISGYPGGGKTVLASQLATDAALEGCNTLICSLEMPEDALLDRMIAYVAHLPGDAVSDPLKYCREVLGKDGPTKELLDAIKRAFLKLRAAPIHIEDLVGANVHKIASCIRRAHRKRPLSVVVVDYAQRIRPAPEKAKESREQQLSHASNHLADLAKELGFCLLLPSQLNKEGAAKHAEAINEDADLHLQIVQDRKGAEPTYESLGIAVVKDRHRGQDGTLLSVALNGPMLRFEPKIRNK